MSKVKNKNLLNLVLSAMFLALGIVLPFLTGQIKEIGNMLLPMHIPVMLCGLVCGWQYGLLIGAVTPILRSALFGMPVMFPSAIGMAFELATYGFVIGYLFSHAKWKCIKSLYRCLLISMICGRVVWGIVQACLLGLGENGFTITMFLSGAFLNAIPGIVLQLMLIPAVMLILGKTHLVHLNTKRKTE
ncbi:MAG: ECF transporter S component [Clostridia bacterium]|nr:ECF transporter S component [Clostridia bacterium]